MKTVEKIPLRSIQAFSLFKLMLVASTALNVLFIGVYGGIMALLGDPPQFTWMGETWDGTRATGAFVLITVVLSVVLAVLLWLSSCVGILICSFFGRPTIDYGRLGGDAPDFDGSVSCSEKRDQG